MTGQLRVLRRIEQAPGYPLFLMVDLFELGTRTVSGARARVHHVRGWATG